MVGRGRPGTSRDTRTICSCGRAEVELGCDLCAYCRDDYERQEDERREDDENFTVLGHCPHGVDLDRAFCPKGCRV